RRLSHRSSLRTCTKSAALIRGAFHCVCRAALKVETLVDMTERAIAPKKVCSEPATFRNPQVHSEPAPTEIQGRLARGGLKAAPLVLVISAGQPNRHTTPRPVRWASGDRGIPGCHRARCGRALAPRCGPGGRR